MGRMAEESAGFLNASSSDMALRHQYAVNPDLATSDLVIIRIERGGRASFFWKANLERGPRGR
jgi:hypothetical protein